MATISRLIGDIGGRCQVLSIPSSLVNFTDSDYSESVLPHDHPLRVSSGEELREKILERDYKSWIRLQSELIDPAWLDWRSWFYLPFRERLGE